MGRFVKIPLYSKWRHKVKGTEYVIVEYVRMKCFGSWVDAVLYRKADTVEVDVVKPAPDNMTDAVREIIEAQNEKVFVKEEVSYVRDVDGFLAVMEKVTEPS